MYVSHIHVWLCYNIIGGTLWVYNCFGASFKWFSWIMAVFPFVIHSGMSASSKHLLIFVMDESEILNQNPCMPSWFGVFQFDIFSVILRESRCNFCLRAFFESLHLFFHVVYLSGFSKISTFSYFAQKLFLSPLYLVLSCLRAFSPYLPVDYFFVVLECFVLSVLFDTN